ncbi:hypothetical protein ACHAXT_008155 [Thalassiosira profunda]
MIRHDGPTWAQYLLSAAAASALTLVVVELRHRRRIGALAKGDGDDDRPSSARNSSISSVDESIDRRNSLGSHYPPIRQRIPRRASRPSFSGDFGEVDGEVRHSVASLVSSDGESERNLNCEDIYASSGTNVVVLPEEMWFADDRSILEAREFNEKVVSKLNTLEEGKLLLRRTRAVSALASRLMAAKDEESCYDVASRLLVPLFDIDRCSYVLMKDADHIIVKGVAVKKRKHATHMGFEGANKFGGGVVRPIKDTMVGVCAETLQLQYCPRTKESKLETQRKMHIVGINTVLATPILVDGNKFAGAIVISMVKEDAFQAYDRILVQDIASMVGANIYSKRMRRSAEETHKISREMLHSMIPPKVIASIEKFWDRNSEEYNIRRRSSFSQSGSMMTDSLQTSEHSESDSMAKHLDRAENDAGIDKSLRLKRCKSVNNRINLLNRINAGGESDSNDGPRGIIMDTSSLEMGSLNQALYAENVKDVVVIFTDIVGFSKMAAEMKPMQVVDMLQSLFSRFDALCDKHGVQKLETIGDAYIATANLFDDGEGSVKDAALKALRLSKDMVRATQEVLLPGKLLHKWNSLFETLSIRVGIHVGEITCGVLGERLPKFTVFGHTVNLAARMEQTCRPNHIRITRAVHKLVAGEDEDDWYGHEVVNVKFLGDIDTYVLDPLDASQNEQSDNYF